MSQIENEILSPTELEKKINNVDRVVEEVVSTTMTQLEQKIEEAAVKIIKWE